MKLPALFGFINTPVPTPGAENAAFVSFQTLPAHAVQAGGRLNQMQMRATDIALTVDLAVPTDSVVGFGASYHGQAVSQGLMFQNNQGD